MINSRKIAKTYDILAPILILLFIILFPSVAFYATCITCVLIAGFVWFALGYIILDWAVTKYNKRGE